MSANSAVLPQWTDGSVTQIVPALLEPGDDHDLLADEVVDATSVVLLVLDGLGWEQLIARPHLTPTLTSMTGRSITTVAPSTTAAALTSITTGTTPGEHGIVGYRIDVNAEILNVLSWRTSSGDARSRIVPEDFQTVPAFLGQRPVVVQNASFEHTGFSRAHLAGTRKRGWLTMPTLGVEVRQAVARGEPFVYAYYDGIDKVAHEFGFGEHYDTELAACDRMVGDLLLALPRGTAVVVTADHGLVDCTNGELRMDPGVLALTDRTSGEGRFRWLHADLGAAHDLLAAAQEAHGDRAWVRSIEQILDEEWFGPTVTACARQRLGDVALVAQDHWTFIDRTEGKQKSLIGRHGSLTAAEMYVPLLTFHS